MIWSEKIVQICATNKVENLLISLVTPIMIFGLLIRLFSLEL